MDRDQIIIIAKDWTGSIMSIESIKREYERLTLPKRGYLWREASMCIKNIDRLRENYPEDHTFNRDFDANLGIIAVNLNVIAASNDVDPAVVILSAVDKVNKKYSS